MDPVEGEFYVFDDDIQQAFFIVPPVIGTEGGIGRGLETELDAGASKVMPDNAYPAPAMVPTGDEQDALDAALAGICGDLLSILPGAGGGQEVNGIGWHTHADGSLPGELRIAFQWFFPLGRIAGIPYFRSIALFIERHSLLKTRLIPSQYSDCPGRCRIRRRF